MKPLPKLYEGYIACSREGAGVLRAEGVRGEYVDADRGIPEAVLTERTLVRIDPLYGRGFVWVLHEMSPWKVEEYLLRNPAFEEPPPADPEPDPRKDEAPEPPPRRAKKLAKS